MTMDFATFELTSKNLQNPSLRFSPESVDLGSEEEEEKIYVQMGNRPIPINLLKIYRASHQEVPNEYTLFDAFSIWLISYGVGIQKRGGFQKVDQINFRVWFEETPRVTILGNSPDTQFIEKASGGARVRFDVGINGKMSDASNEFSTPLNDLTFPLDANASYSSNAHIAAQFSFAVKSPKIIAIGVGSDASEWVISRDNNPLVGDHLLMHTILVPKYTEELRMHASLSVTTSTFNFLPKTIRVPVQPLICSLI